jgi:hypothetical protein
MNMLLKLRFVVVGTASFVSMAGLCAGQQAKPQASAEKSPSDKAASPIKVTIKITDANPEDALRTFMVALLAQDEPVLHAVTVPNPDLGWLLKGTALPAPVLKDLTAKFAKQPIKRLKAGETIALARGKQYTVAASDVGDDKAILLPQGSPVPTRMQKVKGHWKVVADPFIAASKAANVARKKAEAKTAAQKKVAPQQ